MRSPSKEVTARAMAGSRAKAPPDRRTESIVLRSAGAINKIIRAAATQGYDAVSMIRFRSETTTPPGGSRVIANRAGRPTWSRRGPDAGRRSEASATAKVPPSTGYRGSRSASKIQS